MPIIINQIKAKLAQSHESIIDGAVRSLHIGKSLIRAAQIHKISLDARKRDNIHYVCSVFVKLSDERLERKLCEKNKSLTYVQPAEFKPVISGEKAEGRVVVTGCGPA